MLPLLTIIPLLFASTAAPTPETTEGEATEAPAPALEQPEFDAAVERLGEADSEANRDPVAAAEALTEAISALQEFGPELAADEEARELRQYARLNLARAHLLAEEPELAAEVMDEALREAMGETLPAADFGPSLEDLYAERLAALEALGRASLVVRCELPCKIYVNENEVGPELPPLLRGTYRVWVESPSGQRPAVRELVELSEPDASYEVEFAPIVKQPAVVEEPPKPVGRLLPRWSEIALTLVGTGLTTTGAVLMGLDHKDNFQTMGVGAATLVVGATVLTVGVVTLSVDERRVARGASRQAMISWTTKF
ncbi:hypothetical protein ENSA5_23790 [Enhygromyxa salina]|uniref:PEGA domain-containing protein n=1 Tax=Enhygromyxa salina TaxID=215803 RepID=A0A2S9YBD1_9BACT|nr:hypothetical protein [Enhygromyxa salina]PRQ02362.1 hypothetical protein ENSA5_23790 [Enhygromyxa salina]